MLNVSHSIADFHCDYSIFNLSSQPPFAAMCADDGRADHRKPRLGGQNPALLLQLEYETC